MIEINNLEVIRGALNFPEEGGICHVQIIQRKKDSDKGKSSTLIKDYFIETLEDFEEKFKEMKTLAKMFGARVYISLNIKPCSKVHATLLSLLVDRLKQGDYRSLLRLMRRAVDLTHSPKKDQWWLVDVDSKDREIVNKVLQSVGSQAFIVPTKNGFHILSHPFRLDTFKQQFPTLDIHKDNPTLLYMIGD